MLTLSPVIAAEKGVAKVIVLRGQVRTKGKDGKVTALKKNDWIVEGAVIQTGERSFAKMLFIDKSQMSLGPKSQMKITSFPKSKAGIISLMKGQLRSKVSKDYMDINNKNKSKLFIKTKTAAMGVRGTDFQVNYNPSNQATSLITFEGAVSMARIDLSGRLPAALSNRKVLEKMVSSKRAVLVTKGRYSGVSSNTKRPNIPVKISPAQFESMQKNDGSKQTNEQTKAAPEKKYRNIVPAGMNSKEVANGGKEVDKQIVNSIGKSAAIEIRKEVVRDEKAPIAMASLGQAMTAPPEGINNSETGAFAPPAGGLIDTQSGLYVPPPPGSNFDSNTQVYQSPESYGSFDQATGDYVPPAGLELDAATGQFVANTDYVAPLAEDGRAPITEDGRAPASGEEKLDAPIILNGPLPEDGGFRSVTLDAEGNQIALREPSTYQTKGEEVFNEDETAEILDENIDIEFNNPPPPANLDTGGTSVKFNFN